VRDSNGGIVEKLRTSVEILGVGAQFVHGSIVGRNVLCFFVTNW